MIVLDTHAWIWWVSDSERLPERAREAIRRGMTEKAIHISSISTWEVALLVARGRLALTMDVADWVARSEGLPFVHFVPIDNRLAIQANRLPGELHKDRQIGSSSPPLFRWASLFSPRTKRSGATLTWKPSGSVTLTRSKSGSHSS